jgi:hypothetical protein
MVCLFKSIGFYVLFSSVTLCLHYTLLTVYVEIIVSTSDGQYQVPSHFINNAHTILKILFHICCSSRC